MCKHLWYTFIDCIIYVGFHTSTILTVLKIGNQLKFRLPVLNEGLFGLSFI